MPRFAYQLVAEQHSTCARAHQQFPIGVSGGREHVDHNLSRRIHCLDHAAQYVARGRYLKWSETVDQIYGAGATSIYRSTHGDWLPRRIWR